MSEWWTYSLTDFLLFSPRTYYRLFELYNASVWPAHIAAVAIGLALVAFVYRRDGRAVAALLAIAWLWIAVAFHLQRYATINWAALYIAPLFALQAVLIVWTGIARNRLDIAPAGPGLALFAFALILQPAIGPLVGRSWTQVEIFGLAPDPTAVATLGLLLLPHRPQWHLLAIPLAWCAFTGLTLLAMESPDALVTPAAALLALLAAAWKTVAPKRETPHEDTGRS